MLSGLSFDLLWIPGLNSGCTGCVAPEGGVLLPDMAAGSLGAMNVSQAVSNTVSVSLSYITI